MSRSSFGYGHTAVATNYRAFHKNVGAYGGYAAFVAVEPYHVDTVAADLRAQKAALRAADNAEEVIRLKAQIDLLTKLFAAGQGGGNTDTSAPLALQAEASAEIAIVRTHCAKCHSGEGSSGGFALFEADKTSPVPWGPMQKYLIVSAVTSNAMPPKGNEAVSDEDFATLQKWLTAEDRKAVRSQLLKGD